MPSINKEKRFLKSLKYKKIFETFIECFEKFEDFNPKDYKPYFVSVFDHWLTDEEYTDAVISFNDIIANKKQMSYEKIKLNIEKYYFSEAKFITFYSYLYINHKLIFYDKDEKKFFRFKSIENYLTKCQGSTRGIKSDEVFFDVYLPELKCIISGNWDLTHILYCKDSKQSKTILDYARKADLHILE